LCNSANDDIASCNKNKSECFLCFFLNKILFLFKEKLQTRIKKQEGCFENKRVFSTLIIFQFFFAIFP